MLVVSLPTKPESESYSTKQKERQKMREYELYFRQTVTEIYLHRWAGKMEIMGALHSTQKSVFRFRVCQRSRC